jgi:hypothetical protein
MQSSEPAPPESGVIPAPPSGAAVSRTAERGAARAAALALLLSLPLAAYGALSAFCPCERTPGGYLLGREERAPVSDWSFANGAPLCQLQVGSLLPYSINLNCMSSEGRLYISCSSCAGKHWSEVALEQPAARIRIGDAVYPVRLTRLQDPAALDEAWRARARKIEGDPSAPRAEGWWSFELVSR